MRRKAVHVVAMLCLIALFAGSSAIARDKNGGSPASKSKPKVQTTAPAQRSRRVEEHLRKALGATKEQWKSIGPQVMRVDALVQQLEEHRMPGMKGERKGYLATSTGQPTPLCRATAALQKSLADPAASPGVIKAQVAAVRLEREKVYRELQAARAELRQVLTEHQQDQALLLGLLE
jgi:hypothetical protein